MTLVFVEDGSEIETAVRLNTIGLTSAADGSGSVSGLIIDDPTGTREVQGWHPVHVDETACTDAPRLQTGYVAERRYSRGNPGGRTGPDRQIDVDMTDQNIVLALRCITGSDGKRPAETDIERIDWLLGSNYLSGLIVDNGLVNRDFPRMQGEADYRSQFPIEVLTDICGPQRRLFFAYWDQDAEQVSLFYDFPEATPHTSTLTISNVRSDNSDTCFYPFVDAVLTRNPDEVVSRVRVHYAVGSVEENNATTAATFFPSPILHRDLFVENSRIGTEATARWLANNILAQNSVEKDTIACTIQVPPDKVGLLDAGMRVNVRFSHLPGYESFTYTRVTRRTIRQVQGNRGLYEIELELSLHGLSSAGGGGAPPPTELPHVPPPPTQFCCTDPGGVGGSDIRSTEVYRATFSGSTHDPLIGIASFDITGNPPTGDWTRLQLAYSWNGGALAYADIIGDPNPSHGGAPTINLCWNAGALSACSGVAGETPYGTHDVALSKPGVGDDVLRIFGITAESPTGPTTFCLTLSGHVIDQFTGLEVPNEIEGANDGPPAPTQSFGPVIPNETPDGSTSDFTLPDLYRWAAGSLRVYVDRLDQTAAITAQNGAAGTFSLAFSPRTGELVEVYGQGL